MSEEELKELREENKQLRIHLDYIQAYRDQDPLHIITQRLTELSQYSYYLIKLIEKEYGINDLEGLPPKQEPQPGVT